MVDIKLPKQIAAAVGTADFTADSLGQSGAQVLIFGDTVLKVERTGINADREHQMLAWLRGRLPVPEIIEFTRQDGFNWLLMSRMSGENACSEKFMRQPERLVRMMAQALRMLWSVDLTGCPVDRGLDEALRLADIQVKDKLYDIENTEPETFGGGGFADPEELLGWLRAHRPQQELTFTHGDLCLPNVFLSDSGVCGFIDLGGSGAADKYQDISLLSRSLMHNFDGTYGVRYDGYERRMLFDELGIEPDEEKIRYHLLLDELF